MKIHKGLLRRYIAPWEEEGHKCKSCASGMLAIKALKEASKFRNMHYRS